MQIKHNHNSNEIYNYVRREYCDWIAIIKNTFHPSLHQVTSVLISIIPILFLFKKN